MPSIVGIICEYNPFHKGHKYQIDKIRSEIPNAVIVAIMSGNIVQRGEFAIINKYERAKIALECGINAVFELPYPYSGSTAEIFANAGVEIAGRLSCDYLYFGVEKEKIEDLEGVALTIDTPEFENELKKVMTNKSISFIEAKKIALDKLGIKLPESANDMLAVEYIRAIKRKRLNIEYRAIKRVGSMYSSDEISDMMSASAIRKHYYEKGSFISVPKEIEKFYKEIAEQNKCVNKENVSRLLHAHVLLNTNKRWTSFDTSPEMTALIKKEAKESVSSEKFINCLSSKTFTIARLKRAILYSLFDVKNVDFTPKFTILLGMDKKGQEVIKKKSDFYIITKHSDGKEMDDEAKKQLERVYLIDELYNTLLTKQSVPDTAYKNKPIIKK